MRLDTHDPHANRMAIEVAGAEDLENPYDHASSYNGCSEDCPACAWERDEPPHHPGTCTMARKECASIADHEALMHPYSVLLLYPDYLTDGNPQTYYTHVLAASPQHAVDVARRACGAVNEGSIHDPNDCAVLLVVFGHHHDLTPLAHDATT